MNLTPFRLFLFALLTSSGGSVFAQGPSWCLEVWEHRLKGPFADQKTCENSKSSLAKFKKPAKTQFTCYEQKENEWILRAKTLCSKEYFKEQECQDRVKFCESSAKSYPKFPFKCYCRRSGEKIVGSFPESMNKVNPDPSSPKKTNPDKKAPPKKKKIDEDLSKN